jgi:hypothetical protein
MIDKFYEFTQPVMDSFLTKNLTAEFPFDMSPEEIEVIKHNESGTLIMGRSGTGKTTCLIQKLVRNYTARKSLAGQAPIRQVDLPMDWKVLGNLFTNCYVMMQILLTRSRILVEKLKVYTKRLVESQLSKVLPTEEQTDDFTLGEENLIISKTLVSLEDGDFPLVCTFDQLLRLLEQSVESVLYAILIDETKLTFPQIFQPPEVLRSEEGTTDGLGEGRTVCTKGTSR